MNSWGRNVTCGTVRYPVGWDFQRSGPCFSGIDRSGGCGNEYCSENGYSCELYPECDPSDKESQQDCPAIAKRRFTAVLSLTLRSGLEFEKGLELAGGLAENDVISEQLKNALKSWSWVKAIMMH